MKAFCRCGAVLGDELILSRKELLDLCAVYAANQRRGRELVEKTIIEMKKTTEKKECDEKRMMLEMYFYQQGKAAGMKEAIEEIFFKIDGKLPKY